MTKKKKKRHLYKKSHKYDPKKKKDIYTIIQLHISIYKTFNIIDG